MRAIGSLQAAEWRVKLKADKLAEATISKRIKLARQIFRQAVRWKMLVENPFTDIKAGSQMNKSLQRFISRGDIAKITVACPDTQWRLIVGLSRFGGIRCPSETLALKWADVDWEQSRIRVASSKTEQYPGREERYIPLFPELRPHLLSAFEEAEPGSEYVITRYRQLNANLRTQLHRIIRKAGLTPWPRPFHNLRSTRQTELTEQCPAHVVCSWIGNTERVAANHYLQTTDAHFARAVTDIPPVQEAAQKPAQYMAESGSTEGKALNQNVGNHRDFQGDSLLYAPLLDISIAATGIEPVTLGL